MNDDGKGVLGNREATSEQIRAAWEHAALAALEVHERNGEPVVTWDRENHRVLLVPASQFLKERDLDLAATNVAPGQSAE